MDILLFRHNAFWLLSFQIDKLKWKSTQVSKTYFNPSQSFCNSDETRLIWNGEEKWNVCHGNCFFRNCSLPGVWLWMVHTLTHPCSNCQGLRPQIMDPTLIPFQFMATQWLLSHSLIRDCFPIISLRQGDYLLGEYLYYRWPLCMCHFLPW